MSVITRLRISRRWRYSNRYWSRAFGTWIRIFISLFVCRLVADLFWPKWIGVQYSFCNFEYWPIDENIDFVLAIPHWYLRPLMGSLVTIPHHYLGFLYIGTFFILILIVPWINERGDDDIWGVADNTDNEGYLTTRWDLFHGFVFIIFLFSLVFSCAIVPTGRYFITVGSMDMLVFAYWVIVVYILFGSRLGFYITRINWGSY